MNKSTAHMLGILGPSVSKSNLTMSDRGEQSNHNAPASNGEATPQPKLEFAPAPTPSMVDILTHCLGQTKKQDNNQLPK